MSYSYGGTQVLFDVDLRVGIGEFLALVGPNGSGKSTLLEIILGLRAPTAGRVEILGAVPGKVARPWRIGYVPQRRFLDPTMPSSTREVVAAGRIARRGWFRWPNAADRQAVDDALAAVDLADRADVLLRELSGGQQQRVLIAKALVNDPDLLVLDEPVAGVDTQSQRQFRDCLVGLHRRGKAVLLVSHELTAVADDLDRVVVIRRGCIEFNGPPKELAARGVNLGVHSSDLPVWLEG